MSGCRRLRHTRCVEIPPPRQFFVGVEQLTRYLELLNREPLLTAKGVVRGLDDPTERLF